MNPPSSPELRLEHADPSRRIRMIVLPPVEPDGSVSRRWPKRATFELPGAPGRGPQLIRPSVRYLHAVDVSRTTTDAEATAAAAWVVATHGRPDWHVKVYHCATNNEARDLREALALQADAIRQANWAVAGSDPLSPPWGIVPVVIAPGNSVLKRMGAEFPTEAGEHADPPPAAALPDWFLPDGWSAGECVFALTPFVDPLPLKDYEPAGPALHHLRMFEDLAKALDALHADEVYHCDVKPDNVGLVTVVNKSSYALVDADAVSIALLKPRLTAEYTYQPLQRILDHQQRASGKVLRAQDRFGFAVVVLSALAGERWVFSSLLTTPPQGGRPVDDRTKVWERLRRYWPDTERRRLGPLIDTLVEPFEQQRIEDPNWTCVSWLERLSRPAPRADHRDQQRFERYLPEIKEATALSDQHQPELARSGVDALQRIARGVAISAARRSAIGWALLVVLPVVVLAFSYLSQGGK